MSQPSTPMVVRCPDLACGHEINDHIRLGCNVLLPRPASICPCLKTPNDVAYDLVFGELTPIPPPPHRPPPLPDPTIAEGGWRPPMDPDWS